MKILSEKTLATIARIESIPLFRSVGSSKIGPKAIRSWRAAAAECRKKPWRELMDAVSNYYNIEALKPLRDVNKQDWDFTAEVDAKLDAAARRWWEELRAAADADATTIHSELIFHMRWICLETQHPLELRLGFFTNRIWPIYEAGHFPCNWTGERVGRNWERMRDPTPLDGSVIFY